MNEPRDQPRILIIANTSLSSTRNVGKTIASFFQDYPSDCIRQLYFNNEYPDTNVCQNYYRITDFDVIRGFWTTSVGKILRTRSQREELASKQNVSNTLLWSFLKTDFVRLLREFVWRIGKWKSTQLVNWLDDFTPEVVFFCAGDSGFAYIINEYVVKRYKCRSVVYITDDYILPRFSLSAFWWIRRHYYYRKMEIAIRDCDQFITISEKMRAMYKNIFEKDSVVALNVPKDPGLKLGTTSSLSTGVIVLVYAGGLHFNRYKTLRLLAVAIRTFNADQEARCKAELRIYCNQKPTEKERRAIEVEGASKYCGSLTSEELSNVLARSDILVHVESFDHSAMDKTRLSVSTKIPEYMSFGKPILAIGPKNIASMEVLSDVGLCITNIGKLDEKVKEFLLDNCLQSKMAARARRKYESEFLGMNYDNHLLRMIIGYPDANRASVR